MVFLPKPKFGWNINGSSRFWHPQIVRWPTIDRQIQGDIFDHEGQYDLVTAVLAFEYFDYRALLKKVSELLAEGGIFWFLVSYFWYPVNDTRIIGKFPYAAQRLQSDDLERYLRAEHPDRADDAMSQLRYFHKGEQPVLNDYVREADEVGLRVISADRQIPIPNYNRTRGLTPYFLDRFDETALPDVLDDIRQFRNDVDLIDLKTFTVMCGFQKITRQPIVDRLSNPKSWNPSSAPE